MTTASLQGKVKQVLIENNKRQQNIDPFWWWSYFQVYKRNTHTKKRAMQREAWYGHSKSTRES